MIHTPVMTQSFKLMAPYLPQSNKHGIGALAAADLHVPESFLRSGKVKTYYRVTKIGSEPIKSPGAKLWVKLETPGGQLVSGEGDENQDWHP